MKTPEVTLNAEGQLDGWKSFEEWAVKNVPEWSQVNRATYDGRFSHEIGYRLLAYLMTAKAQELAAKVSSLSLIAPRRMKWADGIERIYRCPDELVPLEEPLYPINPFPTSPPQP